MCIETHICCLCKACTCGASLSYLVGCELFEPRSLVEKHETLTLKKKSRSVGGAPR